MALLVSLLVTLLPTPAVRAATTTGAWTNTGDLHDRRTRHTATVLDNGKVLVAGGVADSGVMAQAELYDPATGQWSSTGSMSAERVDHTATLLENGKVLVIGGYNSGHTATVELFDPATGTWSVGAAMQIARREHTATRLADGTVLVTAGSNSNGFQASAERYIPATNSWSNAGSLGTARSVHAAVRLNNGKVLVTGGYSNAGALSTCELYDPATNTWSPTGGMTTPRSDHTATGVAGGKVLVVGGIDNSAGLASAELYDMTTGTWSATGSLSAPRNQHVAVWLTGSSVLVAGGRNSGNIQLATAELYDPQTGGWGSTGSLQFSRLGHTLVRTLDNRVLAIGGEANVNGQFGYLRSTELFDPAASPAVTLDPPALNFGNHLVGSTSPPQVVTLTNSGNTPLAISSISAQPLFFALTSTCPLIPDTLAAGASCTIAVTYHVSLVGPANFPLAVASNALGSPHTVALSGYGIAAPATYPLTLTSSGPGAVTADPPGGQYVPGSTVLLTPVPDANAVFLGWVADGTPRGWGSPLGVTMNGPHTVTALFGATPTFPDLAAGDPAQVAVAQLAGREIVKGYEDGTFGPHDPILRAQMAALIARAMGWDGEDHGNDFPDRGTVDDDLWRNVGTLAYHHVAKGYQDGTFGPAEPVLRAQVISFIARALVANGYWQAQPDSGALYPEVPGDSGHRGDISTYVHYAGALPDLPGDGPFTNWDQPATRAWFARALWQALDSHFGTPIVLP